MVVFHISLLLSAAATASALAQCFTPNGTDRNAIAGAVTYLPCDATAEHSMCCGQANGNPDVCRPGGWCYNDYGNNWWRESCTDKTWQHPSCNKLFVNGTGYPGTGDIIMYRELACITMMCKGYIANVLAAKRGPVGDRRKNNSLREWQLVLWCGKHCLLSGREGSVDGEWDTNR